MSAVACPSCKTGEVRVEVQSFVTHRLDAAGNRVTVRVEAPSSDTFVAAWCDNDDCHDSLAQEPGDGRLRRAGLVRDDTDHDDDPLLAEWTAAVERIIDAPQED